MIHVMTHDMELYDVCFVSSDTRGEGEMVQKNELGLQSKAMLLGFPSFPAGEDCCLSTVCRVLSHRPLTLLTPGIVPVSVTGVAGKIPLRRRPVLCQAESTGDYNCRYRYFT